MKNLLLIQAILLLTISCQDGGSSSSSSSSDDRVEETVTEALANTEAYGTYESECVTGTNGDFSVPENQKITVVIGATSYWESKLYTSGCDNEANVLAITRHTIIPEFSKEIDGSDITYRVEIDFIDTMVEIKHAFYDDYAGCNVTFLDLNTEYSDISGCEFVKEGKVTYKLTEQGSGYKALTNNPLWDEEDQIIIFNKL